LLELERDPVGGAVQRSGRRVGTTDGYEGLVVADERRQALEEPGFVVSPRLADDERGAGAREVGGEIGNDPEEATERVGSTTSRRGPLRSTARCGPRRPP
jgi:hypothetical protein